MLGCARTMLGCPRAILGCARAMLGCARAILITVVVELVESCLPESWFPTWCSREIDQLWLRHWLVDVEEATTMDDGP